MQIGETSKGVRGEESEKVKFNICPLFPLCSLHYE